MPTIEFSDDEMQQLVLILANASGPGISWAATNAFLTKLQQASQGKADVSARVPSRMSSKRPASDGLDLGEADASLPR
jgi:hypothetical protein